VEAGYPTIPIDVVAGQEVKSMQDLLSWTPDLSLPLAINHSRDWRTPYAHTSTIYHRDNLHIRIYRLGEVVSHGGGKALQGFEGIPRDVFRHFLPCSCKLTKASSLDDGDLVLSTVGGTTSTAIVYVRVSLIHSIFAKGS
jgi:hypothetical protein